MEHLYRSTQNRAEIIRILDKGATNECFIWQNIYEKRFIHYIDSMEIDPVLKIIRIEIKARSFKHIHPLSNFYLKLKTRDSVCKLEYLSHSANQIVFYFPEFLKLAEQRQSERLCISHSEQLIGSFSLLSDLVPAANDAYKLHIADISSGGMALLVPARNFHFVKESVATTFHGANEISLVNPPLLKLVYNKPISFKYGTKPVKAYRMGFKFSQDLEGLYLEKLKLNIESR